MGTPLAEILADKNFDVHVTSRKERLSTRQNLSYILGDAKNNDFLLKILQAHMALKNLNRGSTCFYQELSNIFLLVPRGFILVLK